MRRPTGSGIRVHVAGLPETCVSRSPVPDPALLCDPSIGAVNRTFPGMFEDDPISDPLWNGNARTNEFATSVELTSSTGLMAPEAPNVFKTICTGRGCTSLWINGVFQTGCRKFIDMKDLHYVSICGDTLERCAEQFIRSGFRAAPFHNTTCCQAYALMLE